MRNLGAKITFVTPVVLSFVFALLPTNASAFSLRDGINAARADGQPTDLFGPLGIFTSISATLLFVVGVLGVTMIIVGGLRYVVSGGNAASVMAAKNTVLYAIVGIVIAFIAFALINFVLGSLSGGGGAGYTNV